MIYLKIIFLLLIISCGKQGCTDSDACNYDPEAVLGIQMRDCEYKIDCAGKCGGISIKDNCGVCDNDVTNDCLQDCTGLWGGNNVTNYECISSLGTISILECGNISDCP